MTFQNIVDNTIFTGYSSADEDKIINALQKIYNTVYGALMLDAWVNAGQTIRFIYEQNQAAASPNNGIVWLDANFSDDKTYIAENGVAVQEKLEGTIAHELVHALKGYTDNWADDDSFAGQTVTDANIIFAQMGLPEQLSYPGFSSYDQPIELGKDYTINGPLDRVWSPSLDRGFSFTSSGDFNDLIFGHTGENLLNGDLGRDTIYAGQGADELTGGSQLINGVDVHDDAKDLLYGGAGADKYYIYSARIDVENGLDWYFPVYPLPHDPYTYFDAVFTIGNYPYPSMEMFNPETWTELDEIHDNDGIVYLNGVDLSAVELISTVTNNGTQIYVTDDDKFLFVEHNNDLFVGQFIFSEFDGGIQDEWLGFRALASIQDFENGDLGINLPTGNFVQDDFQFA